MIGMRSAQFFAGEQQIVDATGQPTLRTEAKVDEIVLGLRRLFRQWRLHFAMLRVAAARSPQAGLPRSGPAAGSAAVGLLPEELVQKTVLAETEPGASLTARTLRKKFKNHRPVRRAAAQYNIYDHRAADVVCMSGTAYEGVIAMRRICCRVNLAAPVSEGPFGRARRDGNGMSCVSLSLRDSIPCLIVVE